MPSIYWVSVRIYFEIQVDVDINHSFLFISSTGFGRSTRPTFSNDAMVAEKQLVRSIEEWRREMDIEEMNLLGHSMGGFLATSYTMSHPERYIPWRLKH